MVERPQTVLAGAGISMGAPSALPSGDDLAVLAWRLVNLGLGAIPEDLEDSIARHIRDPSNGIRLEQLLEVMSQGVPLDDLVRVYEAVASDAFNYMHARLVELDPEVLVTVNMDSLLEAAASRLSMEPHLVHLHGVHDDRPSIITTISQYLRDLPEHLHQEFGAALQGRSVLVTGYSGRDRDILPMFERYRPSSLVWVLYPGSHLEREVSEVLTDLGESAVVVEERTEDYLDRLLPPAPACVQLLRDAPRGEEVTEWPIPPAAALHFTTRVPTWQKKIAVAAVLRDSGFIREAIRVARSTRLPLRERGKRIEVRKLVARGLRRSGRSRAALLHLLWPTWGVSYRRQLEANVNEIAETLPAVGARRAARRLDRAIMSLGDRGGHHARASLFAQIREAQRVNAEGDLEAAAHAFATVTQLLANRTSLGLGAWVNALTWQADLHKVRGDYQRAREAIETATLEDPYADSSQRAFRGWKAAEIELVFRGPTDEVVEALRELGSREREVVGSAAYFWIRATLIGVIAARGSDDAAVLGRELVAASRSFSSEQRFYLLLQRAELARVMGRYEQARSLIGSALRLEANRRHFPFGSLTGRLAAQLIEAKCRVSTDPGDAVAARLDMISKRLATAGADLMAAHARLVSTAARGEAVDPITLSEWSERGWAAEVDRVGGDVVGSVWQIVM